MIVVEFDGLLLLATLIIWLAFVLAIGEPSLLIVWSSETCHIFSRFVIRLSEMEKNEFVSAVYLYSASILFLDK